MKNCIFFVLISATMSSQSISLGGGPNFPIYQSFYEVTQYHPHSKGKIGYAINMNIENEKGDQLGIGFEQINYQKINRKNAPGPLPGPGIDVSDQRTYLLNIFWLPWQKKIITSDNYAISLNYGPNVDLTIVNAKDFVNDDCSSIADDNYYAVYMHRIGLSALAKFDINYKLSNTYFLFFSPNIKLAFIDKLCDNKLGPLNVNFQFNLGITKSLINED